MNDAEREEHRIVLERLRRHGAILAEAFRLPLRSLDAERPQVKRRYGICYDDGSIRIRLRNIRTGELLKYSSMVDTLCHELAHLKHFDHGRRFWLFYERILAYARRRGIYRPGPERPISLSVIAPPASVRVRAPTPRQRGLPDAAPPARGTSPAVRPEPAQLELF